MTEMLAFPFFRNALLALLIISVAGGIIGTYIISRRLASLCGGVTHACFGGLGLGYFLGINPLIAAAAFAVGGTATVEWLSARKNMRGDSAIAVIWAVGMAIGVLFVFLTPGYVPELNSFLFGNVLTVSTSDLVYFLIYTLLLLAFFLWKRSHIIACAFDPDFARIANLPARFINYTMTVFMAICIVLTIRLAGIMMLMSMLTLPQLTAEVFSRRFNRIIILSIIFSAATSLTALFLATLIDVPCSALIVLTMAALYILTRIIAPLFHNNNPEINVL